MGTENTSNDTQTLTLIPISQLHDLTGNIWSNDIIILSRNEGSGLDDQFVSYRATVGNLPYLRTIAVNSLSVDSGKYISRIIQNANAEIAIEQKKFPIASKTTLGMIKVGDNLTIADNTLSANDPYILPSAGNNTLGGVIIGDNISSVNGKISVPMSNNDTFGVIKAGEGLSAENGILNVTPAGTDKIGGVKIGNNLRITNDGKLSAEHYVLPYASDRTLGGVKIGSGLTVDDSGKISVNTQIDQDAFLTKIFKMIYPVNSIYVTTESENIFPSGKYGTTWKNIGTTDSEFASKCFQVTGSPADTYYVWKRIT